MSNVFAWRGVAAQKQVEMRWHMIDVLLAEDGTAYLGWWLTFATYHDSEIRHIINKGWNAFGQHRKGLCDKSISLFSRLRLCNATVTASVLYGCSTWTINAERAGFLRTAQRKMLRMMLRSPRRMAPVTPPNTSCSSNIVNTCSGIDETKEVCAGETWVEWIRRTTHCAEDCLRKARIPDWFEEQRRRQFRFAGHTARRTDGRWSRLMLDWCPQSGSRLPWRPTRRWADALQSFLKGRGLDPSTWIESAQNRILWAAFSEISAKSTC